MPRFLIIFGCLFAAYTPLQAAEIINITPSQVYAQVERIEADVLSIMKHRKIRSSAKKYKTRVQFKPRHVWQKTYEILVKINIIRNQDHYPTIAVNALEPTQQLHPKMVYDQTQRILTELNLIKVRLNLSQSSPTPRARLQQGKSPNDVYMFLDKVSSDLDTLIGFGFTPSNVFAQIIRINHDIEVILNALSISDVSFPPSKNHKVQPADSYQRAMQLMQVTQHLQRSLSIKTTDFSRLTKDHIDESDVFSLVGLIIAELQPIKYSLSLQHQRTPFANNYEGKSPADVEQMLGWCINKLKQVRSTNL